MPALLTYKLVFRWGSMTTEGPFLAFAHQSLAAKAYKTVHMTRAFAISDHCIRIACEMQKRRHAYSIKNAYSKGHVTRPCSGA